ncbi:S8 family serine peptidase [Candidatus Woesearchaeota archaeon]|nr:S8 family serine peptidase [Candidatus Woesearchaeota archaeon]
MKKFFIFNLIFLLLVFGVLAINSPEHVPGEIIIKLKHSPNKIIINSEGIVETGISIDSLILKYKATKMEKILEKHENNKKELNSFKKHGLDRIFLLKISKNVDIDNALREFNNNPSVEYAEPNYVVYTTLVPNDLDFSKLYGLHNTGQTSGTVDADIDAPEAWDLQTGSNNVVIAVIYTGVDYNHEDLSSNMWTNPNEIQNNGIDDDGNGFIDDVKGWDFYNNDNDPFDDQGHGTHVSGTIGAVGNNNIGVAGVNWNVKVMPVKFLGSDGSGTIAGAISSVQYATLMGAHIMSNSWGGGGFSQALKDAISAANDAGILFVAAAGNADNNNDITPTYPANYDVPNVVAVAATDHNDLKASFSSYGANSVHLGAPGVNVYSTVPTGACSLCSPSGYSSLSGTSMATPHVSGVAGLIKAQFPLLTSDGIKARLLEGVDLISSMQGITVTGGRVNAYNVLSLENDTITPSAVVDLAAVNTTINSATLTWTATGDDENIGKASSYDIRYLTSPITDANWGSAIKATGEPTPQSSGAAETFKVTELAYGTTYYFALKVIDNVGNPSALSNVVSGTTTTLTIIFEDNMESGVNGWTNTSLWHQETKRAYSPIKSWAYNTGAPNYNYDIGTNSGTLTSSVIDLSAYKSAILTFNYLYQTEWLGTVFDQRWVQIGLNGNFTNITQLSGDTMLTWNDDSIDISSYAGKPDVQVRFFFNTVDSLYNNYEGWYIDDVVIVGKLNNKPVANANGPYAGTEDVPVTFDGSGSYDIDGNIISYEWDFGDGTTGIGMTTTHSYSSSGAYIVTLTVTDNNGAKASDTATLNVQSVQISITKHSVKTRWDSNQKSGYIEAQTSFLVNSGSSNKILFKEVTDDLGMWNLQSSEASVRINGVRKVLGVTLDANSDAIIDFGANGIALKAGDTVEITKLKLINNNKGSHSLTSQILANGFVLASNTVNFLI